MNFNCLSTIPPFRDLSNNFYETSSYPGKDNLITMLRIPIKRGKNDAAIRTFKRAMFYIGGAEKVTSWFEDLSLNYPCSFEKDIAMIPIMDMPGFYITWWKFDQHISPALDLILGKDFNFNPWR